MLPATNPIILGVILLAAVGTAVYTYYSSRETPQQHTRYHYTPDDYDYDYSRSYPSLEIKSDSDEGSRRRRLKSGESCTICLSYLEKNIRTLACGHVFHLLCISTWFKTMRNCPICRKNVP